MSDISKDTLAQIKIDYNKTWVTVNLSIITGQIALLNTFYKDSIFQTVSIISIIFFIFAIIIGLGASETFINRNSFEINNINTNSWYYKISPKSENLEYSLSNIAGLLTGFGFGLFILFLIANHV